MTAKAVSWALTARRKTAARWQGGLACRYCRDNDIGASTRSKKPRPDYERMLTESQHENEPMRRLNESLGYRPIPGTIVFRGPLLD